MTYISIEDVGTSPSGKTKRFEVRAKLGNDVLGHISWYAAWRKYCFAPLAKTFYEETCLREIADYIVYETHMHNTNRANMIKQ